MNVSEPWTALFVSEPWRALIAPLNSLLQAECGAWVPAIVKTKPLVEQSYNTTDEHARN